jgi:hypothetical protein
MVKRLPYNKTVVTQFRVDLADLVARNTRLRGSLAAPIPNDYPFNSSDQNATAAEPVALNDIHSVAILYSFEPFVMDITQGGNTIQQTCTGLFIFHGALDRIVVTPPAGVERVRVSLIYA